MDNRQLSGNNSSHVDPILAAFLKIHEKPIVDVVEDYLHSKPDADHLLFTRLNSISAAEKNRLGEWLTNYCLLKVINNESTTALEFELFASVMAYDIVRNAGYSLIQKLLKKSIDMGNHKASVNLAYFYQEGLGVSQNYGTAFALCSNAYQKGYTRAGYNLAFFYANGYYVTASAGKVLELYTIAANAGSDSAMNALGNLHASGTVVEKNPKEAVKWYEEAVKRGSVDGLLNLAKCYEEGNGLDNNLQKTVTYYEQAAKKNSAVAFYRLGQLYEHDLIQGSKPLANEYFIEADKRGYRPATHLINRTQGFSIPDNFIREIRSEPSVQNFDTLKELITQLLEPPLARQRLNHYIPPSQPRSPQLYQPSSYSNNFNSNNGYSDFPYVSPLFDSRSPSSSPFSYEPALQPRSSTMIKPMTTAPSITLYSDRDDFDYAVVKAMVDLFIDNLTKVPNKAPELLKKIAVPQSKTKDQIEAIIKIAFTGETIPVDKDALVSDLVEINSYAIKSKAELRFKSKINYSQSTIAKMVHDATLEAVLENLTLTIPNKQTKLVEISNNDVKPSTTTNLRLFDTSNSEPNPKQVENDKSTRLQL